MLLQNYSNSPTLVVGNYTLFTSKLLGKGATGSVYRGILSFTKDITI